MNTPDTTAFLLAQVDFRQLLQDSAIVAAALILWILIVSVSSYFVRKRSTLRSFVRQLQFILLPAIIGYVAVWNFWGWDAEGKPTTALLVAETVVASAGVVVVLGLLNLFFSARNLRLWTGKDVPGLLLDVVRYLLIVVAVAMILKIVWGEDVTPLIGALGIGGIVLGLALQETLSNFFNGLAMLAERPFSIGDWIRVGDGEEGRVEHITWRAVKIRSRNDDYHIYPNSLVAKDKVINFNLPTRVQAVRLFVGTSYKDPPDVVKRTILEILEDCVGVLADPRPIIYTKEYADFAINYEIRFHLDDYTNRRIIEDRVMSRIWYAFRRKGIEIPFPIRTVYHRDLPASALPSGERVPAEDAASRRTAPMEAVLSQAAIFRDLSPLEVQIIAAGVNRLEYGYGERVVRQGDAGATMYVISSGTARVSVRGEDGVERDVASLHRGDIFGEMSLLTGGARTASVYSQGDLEVIEVGKEAVAPLLEDNPDLAEKLAELVALRREGLDRAQAEGTLAAQRMDVVRSTARGLLGQIRVFFGL